MAEKLTKVQERALRSVAISMGRLNAWCIGTDTAEALRKRGLVYHREGNRPFTTRTRDNETVHITEAGLAALKGSDHEQR